MAPRSNARTVELPVESAARNDSLVHEDVLTAFERCPLGIMQLTVKQEVVYANQAAMALTGWSNYAGRTIRDLIGDETAFRQFQANFQKRLQGSVSEYESEFTRPDGRRIPVRVAASPIMNADGKVSGSIGVIRSLLLSKAAEALDKRIVTCKSAHQVFEVIADEVAKRLPYELCAISLYTDDLSQSRMVFNQWASGKVFWPARYFDLPPEMRAFLQRREPAAINDLKHFRNDPRRKLAQDPELEAVMQNLSSAFRIPVVRQDRVVGSISFFRSELRGFDKPDTTEDVEILKAMTLDKAVLNGLALMEQEDRRFREDLTKELAAREGLDLLDKAISDLIVQRLAEHYDWEAFAILRVNHVQQRFELQSNLTRGGATMPEGYTQAITKGVLGRAYRENNDQRSSDVMNDPAVRPVYIPGATPKASSEMCLPIRVEGEIVALLNIEDSRRNAFSAAEEKAVRSLLDHASALIERRRSENIIKASFEWTPSAVFIASEAGLITKANPAAADMLGYTDQELKGKPLLEVLEPEENVLSMLRVSCPFRDDINLIGKDGRKTKASVASSRLGEGAGTILSARDLTSRQRIEELGYLGRIFYDIAAQTKIPLGLTFSWLSKLKQQLESGKAPPAEAAADALCKALQQLRKIEITYDHLVLYDTEIAGGLPGNPVILELGRLVEQLIREFPEDDRKRLAFSGNALNSYVRGDTYQISFVLLALLSYATRFTPERGKVPVEVASRDEGGAAWVDVTIGAVAPPPPQQARREVDTFVNQVITDINLGARIIESFVAANGGVFRQPEHLTGAVKFHVSFPVADLAG